MNVTVTIRPDPRTLSDGLVRLRKAFADLRAPLREAQGDFIKSQERNFAGGGETHWPPLAASTVAEKTSEFPGRPVLVATGALRGAMTGGRAGFQANVRADRLEIHLRDPKAIFHQRGTRHMPARQLVDPDVLRRPWLGRIEDHLRKAVAAVGDATRRA